MPGGFLGFDHVDARVPSLAAVEAFYDALMPMLGLARKRTAYVDPAGDWHEPGAGGEYNAIEYYEPAVPGRIASFIGFIERTGAPSTLTRIAFRVRRGDLETLQARIEALGAKNVERSADMDRYPAVFFEDPAGTKLEIVARPPA